ncbi:ATP-binding protein [Williamsia maris]|uniref:Kinase n=2 Tax=Williamsia maris TaxID=72806 RepID=A0ABT1HHT9_9NOCA|nr:putative kinase [Williamsia maris]
MSRLILMCGMAGAGKSTYARTLEDRGWVRFSIDAEAWGRGFTGSSAVPPEVAADIRAGQRVAISDALGAGADVVVDYAFPSRAMRDEYRELGRTHRAEVEVVFLDTDASLVRDRLTRRRGSHPDDVVVDEGTMEAYRSAFEAPTSDEGEVTVIRTPR